MLGARKCRIGIARDLDEVRREIIWYVGVNERRAILQRRFQVHFDRQRLEVHLDQSGRILRRVAVDRDDHGDGLPDVINVAARQRPLGLGVLHRRMRNEQRHRHIEWADVVAGIDRGHARIVFARRSRRFC